MAELSKDNAAALARIFAHQLESHGNCGKSRWIDDYPVVQGGGRVRATRCGSSSTAIPGRELISRLPATGRPIEPPGFDLAVVSLKGLKETVLKAVERYNRYRSPEATARLVEVGEEQVVVDFSGPFCTSCGVYDYFEDLVYESEALAQAQMKITGFDKTDNETFRVRYSLPVTGTRNKSVDAFLRDHYLMVKAQVDERLAQFGEMLVRDDREIFAELCFCICTPQTSAKAADRAIGSLKASSLLSRGTAREIGQVLTASGVRYGDNKARFIVGARELFSQPDPLTGEGGFSIKERLPRDPKAARGYLAENVKGLGLKEASHFLRNIGYRGLAILDRHVLRTLQEAGVIDQVPKALTRKRYLEIEQKFLEYADRIGISPDALDLVMWSSKTGEVFR